MRLDGGDGVPAHAGTRREMAFEMIGVEFDQARQKKVAAEILAGTAGAGVDVGDASVDDAHRAVDDLVCKDNAGVGEDGFGRHVRQSFVQGFGRAGGRPGP